MFAVCTSGNNCTRVTVEEVCAGLTANTATCIYSVTSTSHVRARLHVADGGDGLQIWRVATNIVNKRLRAADKRWSSSLEAARAANSAVTNCCRDPELPRSLEAKRALANGNGVGRERIGLVWLRIGAGGVLL
jgi:hypothetical protein